MSDRPEFKVFQGGATPAASGVAAELNELEKFIAQEAKHHGFSGQDVSALHAEISASEALRHLDARGVKSAIFQAFHNKAFHEVGPDGAIPIGHIKQVTLEDIIAGSRTVDEQKGKIAPLRPEAITIKNPLAGSAPKPKPKAGWLESVATEHKVNAGIWFAAAALSALGVYSAAKNSVTQDETGKSQVQWSQAGVALLQACLAAGCAYMGAQALRAGSAVH